MILLNCILLVLCCDITVLQVCSGSTVDKLLREDMRRRLKGGGPDCRADRVKRHVFITCCREIINSTQTFSVLKRLHVTQIQIKV